MTRALRKAIASYRLMHARMDVKYWESALTTATYNLKRSQRIVKRMENAQIEIEFPKPRGVKA